MVKMAKRVVRKLAFCYNDDVALEESIGFVCWEQELIGSVGDRY